jgi:carbamoyltransferase
MYILGISAFYHDSAASLIKDGEIICAVEEERFSRIKHDNNFPFKAVEFCLADAGITIGEVDYLSYYEKPLLKFERILDTFVKTYPLSLSPFVKSIPDWIGEKIQVEKNIKKDVGFEGQVFYISHHMSHASSTYYPSSFRKSAILTIDGVGEYQTTGLWLGKGCKITPIFLGAFVFYIHLLFGL